MPRSRGRRSGRSSRRRRSPTWHHPCSGGACARKARPRERGAGARVRILDPACGDGVFLARAAARGAHAVGVEIDPHTASTARSHTTADVRGRRFPHPRAAAGSLRRRGWESTLRAPGDGGRRERAHRRPRRRRLAGRPGGRLERAGRSRRGVRRAGAAVRSSRRPRRVRRVRGAARGWLPRVLRGFLAGRGRIAAVVASPRERWFHDAAVHGVLVVSETGPRPGAAADDLRAPPRARRRGGARASAGSAISPRSPRCGSPRPASRSHRSSARPTCWLRPPPRCRSSPSAASPGFGAA